MTTDLERAAKRVLKTAQAFGAGDEELHAHYRALAALRKALDKKAEAGRR